MQMKIFTSGNGEIELSDEDSNGVDAVEFRLYGEEHELTYALLRAPEVEALVEWLQKWLREHSS